MSKGVNTVIKEFMKGFVGAKKEKCAKPRYPIAPANMANGKVQFLIKLSMIYLFQKTGCKIKVFRRKYKIKAARFTSSSLLH